MKLPKFSLSLVTVISLFASACGDAPDTQDVEVSEAPAPAFEVIDVNPAEALKLVDSGEVIILDVRTPAEFKEAHLSGAILADVNGDTFRSEIAKLDFTQPLLVHCASGGRSRIAVDALKEAGASTLYHLNGGMGAWLKAGNPVEAGEN